MGVSENRRLNSWKQIARYLGRDRRTVMRWEKRWGMPVWRPGGDAKGSSVYAFTAELDGWLEQGGASAMGGDGQDRDVEDGFGANSPRLAWWIGAAAAVVIIALTGLTYLKGPAAPPSTVVTAEDVMIVLAADGSVAWSYRHPERYRFNQDEQASRFIDLDGDGANELVLSTNTVSPVDASVFRGELLAFASDRTLAWRVIPTDSLAFGEADFGPPWVSSLLDVATVDGEVRLVWRVHHPTWWPAIVMSFGTDGALLSRFVNSGWILTSGTLARPEGDLLLVGGISNSRGGAMLAVLDPNATDGSSPEEEGSPYECLNCPPGNPIAYFVFGPSHVNRASGLPYNRTASIETIESGFKAVVMEGGPSSDVQWVYEFSDDLELLRAVPGDTYWPQHERLRLQGLIDHGEEECPEHDGSPPMSIWTPDGGWRHPFSVPTQVAAPQVQANR